MVPPANPKACWGMWDETGVTKAKSQPRVALPTVPGSWDASVHAALKYVLLLLGAEVQRVEQLPTTAQQGKTREATALLRSGWVGQWDQLVTSGLRLTRPLICCHDDAVVGVHFKPLSMRLLSLLPATPSFLHTVGWGAGDTGLQLEDFNAKGRGF